MFHSFTKFHRNSIAAAALFLAAKVEEQPRKLEHVIKVSHICLHRDQPHLDSKSEQYLEQASELVSNENILLQTLGFDVAIDHPHTHVVKCCQLVKASKELAQTSYFMATNSLHLTTMCLRYPPTIVACVCIHLACKWSKYEIPLSVSGKPWYSYVDPTSNIEQIERLTKEFLTIFDKCPSRLKKKILQSHNDTKEEEDRRARENTQSTQYRLDFEGKPSSGQPTPGQSVPTSARQGSSSSQSKPAGSRPQSQPPSSGQHKYPPGHPGNKPPPPSHSKQPPGHPPVPTPGQHPSKQAPPPSHHSSSKNVPPPGYRPGQPKHGEKPQVPPPGHRPGSHSRSQSHGGTASGQPLSEEQIRAAKERERRDHSQSRDHSRTDMKVGSMPGMPIPGGGYPPGYRTSATTQPPPYPGQPHTHQNMGSKGSSQVKPPPQQPKQMSRSIFDLSPEKASRPEKPPPAIAPISDPAQNPSTYHHDTLPPYPGHHPPPTYPDPSVSIPSYAKPSSQPVAPFQPPLSLSPIRDRETPALPPFSRQPSLEPGELLDTPTPTHIASMFSYPPKPGYSTKPAPAVPPPKPKDDNRSLQSILGFGPTGGSSKPLESAPAPPPPSKLQQDLFGPDFDLQDPSNMPMLPLPSGPTLPPPPTVKSEVKTEPSVSDFSDLFGEDSNSTSNFMSSFSQSRPSFANTFNPGVVKSEPQALPVKQEPRVKQEAQHTQPSHSKLPASPLKPPKREKDSSESKRKSAGGSSSEEKKPRLSSRSGGLFSPSPERKPAPPLPTMKSPLLSPQLTSPTGQGKRTRTISTNSNGEAMVNVQKLENIAPEFQAFKGTHGPASILVGPDGQPSPRKGPEDSTVGAVPVAHQPWVQGSVGSTTTASVSSHTSSPHKLVKKDDVSPVKGGSGHKKERRSSGDSHSDKKRSSSGHHRSDKHTSKSGTVSQGKEKVEAVDPAPPPPSLADSPAKQASVAASGVQSIGQEISPSKKDEEEKRKHREKKDDKHKKKKEKKEKKEKKDKKDKKERKEGDEKKDDKERKHKSKKKSKDRDKEKERDKDRTKVPSGNSSTPSVGKLTIKMGTPTVSPGRSTSEQEQSSSQATTPGSQPAIPKIKLKLGGNITQIITPESNSSSKKDRDKDSSRKRSSSAVKLDKLEGPAAKMARAIGTDPSKEARFLEESIKKTSDRKVVKPRLLPN